MMPVRHEQVVEWHEELMIVERLVEIAIDDEDSPPPLSHLPRQSNRDEHHRLF